MEKLFDITLQSRKRLYKILDSTSRERLLEIPNGYNNNIWWNIAHVVVTQQLLVYKLSGLKIRIPDEFVDKFKKGTVPDGTATEAEIKEIENFLISTCEWMKEDYENGLFQNFNEYTTSAGVTLKSTDDAIAFNLYHEGLHIGAIIALLHAVKVDTGSKL